MYEMSDKKMKELKQEFKDKEIEKTSFQDLEGMDKVNHIWSYYRFHIIGTILAIVFVVSIASAVITNLNTVTILDATFLTRDFNYDTVDTLEAHWHDLLDEDFPDAKITQVVIDYNNISEDADVETQQATQAKFTAKIMTKDFDVFFMEKSFFVDNSNTELLLDLETVINLDDLDVGEDQLVYVDDILVGIEIRDVALLEEANRIEDTWYLGGFAGTLKPEVVGKVIMDLFEK